MDLNNKQQCLKTKIELSKVKVGSFGAQAPTSP